MTNHLRRMQTRSRLMTGTDPIRHNEIVALNRRYRRLSREMRRASLMLRRVGRAAGIAAKQMSEAFHG